MDRSTFAKNLALTVVAILSSTHSLCSLAAGNGIENFDPQSYVDKAGIWKAPRLPIPVCWDGVGDTFKQEKQWVESAVATIMEEQTKVRFSGQRNAPQRWGDCTPASRGIRISVTNGRPESEVGRQWITGADNKKTEAPTRMQLNFTLDGPYQNYCKSKMEHCVRLLAVHEFMHAISFLHEQLHPDAPAECKERFLHVQDVKGIDPIPASIKYDKFSIMNYCENIFRTPIQLSKRDIQAVDAFYEYQ